MLRLLLGLSLCLGLVESAFADPPEPGAARGQILLEGEIPHLLPLIEQGADVKDAACCAKQAIPDESLISDPQTSGIANVCVYLRKPPAGYSPPPVSETPVIVTIRNCRFEPHVCLIRAGQQVLFESEDACVHNHHFWPIRNQPTSAFMKANGRINQSFHFTQAEIIPVKLTCDIHSWMVGYAMVLDHPLAAITDARGRFEIKGLPPGEHAFIIWHERVGYLERGYKVTVEAGKVTELPPLKVPVEKFGTD